MSAGSRRCEGRALIVSGGCLIRPSHAAAPLSVGGTLTGQGETSPDHSRALSFLRDAVHRWVNEGEDGAAVVICADRGFDHARLLGLTPDLIVGDMDSMSAKGRSAALDLGRRLDVHPPRKDASDTEIAVEHALSMGAESILMVAALGGRVDHELANIMLLAGLAMRGRHAEALDNLCRVLPVAANRTRTTTRVLASPGDLLTLIPLSGECRGVSLLGPEYPLSEATLAMGTSRGVSNVFVGPEATVSLTEGLLLAIVTFARRGQDPNRHSQPLSRPQ